MSYQTFLKKLRSQLNKIPQDSERKKRYQIIVCNWKIGELIVCEHFIEGNAPRNEHLFERLSRDLGKNKRFLQYTVQFYKAYLKAPKDNGLTWTHYQYLLSIKNPEERAATEKQILKEKISSPKMKEFMALRSQKNKIYARLEAERIVYTRGIPYTYRIIKNNYTSNQPSLITIDLGFYFDIHFPLTQKETYQPGHIVQVKKDGGNYHVSYKKATHDILYTYKAYIERIIDADTMKMHIDCGFKTWTHQTIRLRGIDAPERMTFRGKQAKQYVEKILKDVPYVVIKTYGTDSFGRYLADVFCELKPNAAENVARDGLFLNQQLLDSGHAVFFK